MDKQFQAANGADTAWSILALAFGEKYYRWISLPLDDRLLTEEEKKTLAELIEERDHYEIKQIIIKK